MAGRRRRGGRRPWCGGGRRHVRLPRGTGGFAAGIDGLQCGDVDDPRGRHTQIALERLDRGDRRVGVAPVDGPGVEAELGERLLEPGNARPEDVGAATEPFAQRGVGRRVVLTGFGQPEITLQRGHRSRGRVVEDARHVTVVVPEHLQRLLELGNEHG